MSPSMDISFCPGKGCMIKKNCFRWLGNHKELRFASVSQFTYKDGKCDHFYSKIDKSDGKRRQESCKTCNHMRFLCEHGFCKSCTCKEYCWLD